MPKRYVIIDGYNFLHAAGMMPKKVDGESLARARKRLATLLLNRLTDSERSRLTIAYDVHVADPKIPAVEKISGMTIHNAIDFPDADTLIEHLIKQHPTPKQLQVVSSDHRLHKAARARKAQPIDSEEYFDKLSRKSERPTATTSSPREKPSPGDDRFEELRQEMREAAEEWLNERRETPESIPDPEIEMWQRRVDELNDEID